MTLFADITTTRRAGNKFCMSLANCSPIRSEASHLVISTSTSNLKKNNFVWDCFDVRTDHVEVRCMGVVFSAGMRVCQHNSAYTCECVWAYMSMKITCTWIFLYKHVCISGNIYKCSAWPVVSICHFGNSCKAPDMSCCLGWLLCPTLSCHMLCLDKFYVRRSTKTQTLCTYWLMLLLLLPKK